jgi:hypothetical protein
MGDINVTHHPSGLTNATTTHDGDTKTQRKVEWDRGSGRTRCARYFIYLIQTFNYFTFRKCDEEGSPLLESPISTQDDKYKCDGKGYTPFSSCFYPHRRDEKASPISSRFYIHRRDEKGKPVSSRFYTHRCDEKGKPVSSHLYTHRHDEKGFPLSRRVSIHRLHTDMTRRGFPLLIVFLSTQTR